jgi:hypothetical protein
MEEKLLDFFKTFVDVNRMRLAVLLLEDACTVDEIATRLKLRVGEVVRHLKQLEKLGLLKKESERFLLDRRALEALSREIMQARRPVVEVHSNDEQASDFDRQVVSNYSFPDGRLKEIPVQEKKLLSVLRHIIQVFEPGVRYNEKQVNESLARFHEDYVSLRRYLVDRQMILREANGTAYWRAESG